MAPGKSEQPAFRSLRAAGMVSAIGILLVVSTAIGYFFGSWLDRKLGTDPWFMLVFTILGIAAGFIEMIKLVIAAEKEE